MDFISALIRYAVFTLTTVGTLKGDLFYNLTQLGLTSRAIKALA